MRKTFGRWILCTTVASSLAGCAAGSGPEPAWDGAIPDLDDASVAPDVGTSSLDNDEDGLSAGDVTLGDGTSTVPASSVTNVSCRVGGRFYTLETTGQMRSHDAPSPGTGTAPWFPSAGVLLSNAWNGFQRVLAAGNGVFYGIDAAGALHWYRNTAGTPEGWAAGSGRVIRSGFGNMVSVIADGNGVLYALTTAGELQWFRHSDPLNGAANWDANSGQRLASGWSGVRGLIAGGRGVIYTVAESGDLNWYRHANPGTGAPGFAPGEGSVLGTGGQHFVAVISLGAGVFYAVDHIGGVYWYRHADPLDGEASWVAGSGQRVATGFTAYSNYAGDVTTCTLGTAAPPTGDAGVPRTDAGPTTDAGSTGIVLPTLVHGPLLKWGLHPRASDALRTAGVPVSRIWQTIGSASASAGTHAQDGTVDGQPYSAATDLRLDGLTDTQVRALMDRLQRLGFAAYYRRPGYDGWPSGELRHAHVVYAGCVMKSSLDAQISDFLRQRNALASHTTYTFMTFSDEAKQLVRYLWDRYN